MPVLTIRLSPELHARFLAECEKREISPSEFGRKAIEAIVDRLDDVASPRLEAAMKAVEVVGRMPRSQMAPTTGIRGFAMDGSPIVTKRDRLKTK